MATVDVKGLINQIDCTHGTHDPLAVVSIVS